MRIGLPTRQKASRSRPSVRAKASRVGRSLSREAATISSLASAGWPVTPAATPGYSERTAATDAGMHAIASPSAVTVLRYFGSFRAAWASLGLALDPAGAPWTDAEDRYLREHAGRLPTATIARALDRSVNGVKLRLRRLDLRIREAHGWPLERVQRASGVPVHVLRRYIGRGELPVLIGAVCTYVDPADLVMVTELDWAHVSSALQAAALGSLRWRLVQVLAGHNWRAMRPHRPVTAPPPPRPAAVAVGSCVRVVGAVPTARGAWGRVGRLERVFWSASRRGSAPEWRARVRFAKQRRRRPGGTIAYVLPLAALKPAPTPDGDMLPAVAQHQLARIECNRTSHSAM